MHILVSHIRKVSLLCAGIACVCVCRTQHYIWIDNAPSLRWPAGTTARAKHMPCHDQLITKRVRSVMVVQYF